MNERGESGAAGVSPSLVELLWEPDMSLATSHADDSSARVAALSLQLQQSAHAVQDSDPDWSEVVINLPRAAAPPAPARRSAPSPEKRVAAKHQASGGVGRHSTSPRPPPDGSSAANAPSTTSQEILLRLIYLLASPDLQRRLAKRLGARSLQQEIVQLWFRHYRPVECEEIFGKEPAARLRVLSAHLRNLLKGWVAWNLPIDALMLDSDWEKIIRAAGDILRSGVAPD